MQQNIARFAVSTFTALMVGCVGGGGSDTPPPATTDTTINDPTVNDPNAEAAQTTTWVTRSRTTGRELNDIAYSGTRYVAIGSLQTVTYSDDGAHWVVVDDPYNGAPAYGIAWGNGLFVAVGTFGVISTSPDGLKWTKRSECPGVCTDKLLAVTWSGSRFVAVGENGMIYTSDDGLTWAARTSGTTATLTAVAWSGSRFVVVGATAPLYSVDGISWTAAATPPSGSVADVTWADNRFLASGWDGVFASADGAAWSKISATMVYNIAWNGSVYVGDDSVGGMRYSNDAIDWTPNNYVFQDQFTHRILTIPGKNEFIVVGGKTSSSGLIASSSDGITWDVRMNGVGMAGVVWDGARFLAIDAVGRFFNSSDGAEWSSTSYTPYAGGGVVYYADLAWSDTVKRYVTITSDDIRYSDDGNTWHVGYSWNSSTTTNFKAVNWVGNAFVAVAYNGGFLKSDDGVNWNAIGTINEAADSGLISPSIQDIAWSSSLNLFVAVGNKYAYTSADGVDWTPRAVTSKTLYGVTFAGDKFVAVGADGVIFTSVDGATWTQQSSGTASSLYDVASSAGTILAVGGGGTVRTSADGITWSGETTNTKAGLSAIAASSVRTVAVGGAIVSRP